MKILIAGDLVINQVYQTKSIDQNLIDFFEQSDLNIINLEAPITSSTSKILKTGPHLKSHKDSTLKVLKTLNIHTVTLANNHLLDYDQLGARDTLKFCNDNNIQTVGGGLNLDQAQKTLYIDSSEGKIAIVNIAENEWSSATEATAGANPMDIIDNANQIKEAKEKSNYVIVIVHGGHEYYNLPSLRVQKQYRFYAEQGADIVVGHHTHCISGSEIYKGVPIYYSLGNFLFTKASLYEDWYLGLVLEITINEGELNTKLHPVKQEKVSFELSLLNEEIKQEVLSRIENYNNIIANSEKLRYEWNNYVKSKYSTYLNYWTPLSFIKNKYIKAILIKLNVKFINRQGAALALNLMRCEAHFDMSKEVLTKYLKKKK